jgi:hypothetical protein
MTAGAYGSISEELKESYPSGTFPDAQNKEARYRKSLNKVDLKFADGVAKFPLHLNSSWNVTAIDDYGSFPDADDPDTVKGECVPEYLVGAFKVGKKTQKLASNKKTTFYDGGIIADRVERTIADLGKACNIIYAGSNRGRIGVVASDGSNTLVLDTPLGTQLVKEGMKIDVYTALSSGAVRDSLSSRKITAIVDSTRTVTYNGADQTAVAGDSVFFAGMYGRTFYSMPDIVDDGINCPTIFAKSRATYPGLKAQVLGAGGSLRNLDEQLILSAISRPWQKTGKRITRVISNDGQARKLVEYVTADRRFAGVSGGGKPKYTIGYDEDSLDITAPGVSAKLEIEPDAPPRSMFFLAWDTFGLYENSPMDWVDEGDVLHLIPGGTSFIAGLIAFVGSIENQFNTMPAANSRLDDLKDVLVGDN